jgi:hypothetical protein
MVDLEYCAMETEFVGMWLAVVALSILHSCCTHHMPLVVVVVAEDDHVPPVVTFARPNTPIPIDYFQRLGNQLVARHLLPKVDYRIMNACVLLLLLLHHHHPSSPIVGDDHHAEVIVVVADGSNFLISDAYAVLPVVVVAVVLDVDMDKIRHPNSLDYH